MNRALHEYIKSSKIQQVYKIQRINITVSSRSSVLALEEKHDGIPPRTTAGLGFVVDRRLGASTEDEKWGKPNELGRPWRERLEFTHEEFPIPFCLVCSRKSTHSNGTDYQMVSRDNFMEWHWNYDQQTRVKAKEFRLRRLELSFGMVFGCFWGSL